MIITKQKKFDDLLNYLVGCNSIFILGCGDCATLCRTGGEDQTKEMRDKLEKEGKNITGTVIGQAPCHELDTARILRQHRKQIEMSDGILVLACGSGAQAVRESTEKKVFSGCDSLFIGNSKRQMRFYEKCSACGDCVINDFGGICPITRCPKSLMNGPCGGSTYGKCEVNNNAECIWNKIFNQLKLEGRFDALDKIQPPKNHGCSCHPSQIE